MARFLELTPNRTYATKANAIKAVEKKFPDANDDGLHYILYKTDDNRYFPVFLGMRSIQAGVHFHFNCAA